MSKISSFDIFHNLISESSYAVNAMPSSIWMRDSDSNVIMDPRVKNKLIRIAENFWSSISPLFGEMEIYDIQISGDLADLNNLSTDIDLHIIINPDGLSNEEIQNLNKEFEKQKFQLNLERPKKVRGFDVDLFINSKDGQHDDSGLFSLIQNKWISEPKIGESFDSRDVDKKYYSLGNAIETIASKLSSESCSNENKKKLLEKASRLKKKLQTMMSSSLDNSKSHSIDSKTYKKLKKEGYINKLVRILP